MEFAPSGDHFGSVGDSILPSFPAKHCFCRIFLIIRKCNIIKKYSFMKFKKILHGKTFIILEACVHWSMNMHIFEKYLFHENYNLKLLRRQTQTSKTVHDCEQTWFAPIVQPLLENSCCDLTHIMLKLPISSFLRKSTHLESLRKS